MFFPLVQHGDEQGDIVTVVYTTVNDEDCVVFDHLAEDWTLHEDVLPAGSGFHDLTYDPDNDLFFTFSATNVAYTLDTGATWTANASPRSYSNDSRCCYSPTLGKLLIVTSSGGPSDEIMLSSDNGVTWPESVNLFTEYGLILGSPADVIWIEELGIFVIMEGTIGQFGTTRVLTSPNGLDWTIFEPFGVGASAGVGSFCWSPQLGKICAVAGGHSDGSGDGAFKRKSYNSDDGEVWETHDLDPTVNHRWIQVIWSKEKGKYVAIAGFHSTASLPDTVLAVSEDGENWDITHPLESRTWKTIVWNGRVFVVFSYGGAGSDTVLVSSNLVDFASVALPAGRVWNMSASTHSLFL